MIPNPPLIISPMVPTLNSPTQHRDIPVELQLIIIKLLAKPELARCCRVSQSFSSLATPLLYEKLHVDLFKPETFPVFLAEDPKDLGEPGSGEEVEVVDLGDVDELGLEPRLHTHHNRFSFTKHLTIITSHSDMDLTSCKRDLPLLPDLETVRICIVGEVYVTCASHMSTPLDIMISSLFARLRPRRLVIDDDTFKLETLLYRSNSPCNSMEELVVVVGLSESCSYHWPHASCHHLILESLSRGVPPSFEQLTLILKPDIVLAPPSMSPPALWTFKRRKIECARLVAMALAGACRSKGIRITVVGAEGAGLDMTDPAPGAIMEEMKVALQVVLDAEGWKEKDAAIMVEGIKLVEMKDYDGEM